LLLCGPWGNYPLNDDWSYARTARKLAETGTLAVDPASQAAVVGQALLATPIIWLFGFSHTLLRLLTIAFGTLGLWAVDRLLRLASCPADVRLPCLLLLAFNPLYFYSSATFMTEIYGLVLVLLAAVLWFLGRSRSAPEGPVVGVGVALAAGGIIGATFWIRQTYVVWFGALLGASALRLVLDRDWARCRRSILPAACGVGIFALVVGLYFPWAWSTRNFPAEFSKTLGAMSAPDGATWSLQAFVYLAYMSVFLAPLLLLIRARDNWKRALGAAAALVIVSWLGAERVAAENGPEIAMAAWLRRTFPYLHNLFFNAGIGPVTLAEVYHAETPVWPHWPNAYFRGLHVYSILAVGLWALLLTRLRSLLKGGRQLTVEVFFFGVLGAGLSLALTIQAFQMKVLDRYHLPGVLGGVLAIGAFLGFQSGSETTGARRWPGRLAFGVPWLLLSLFTAAGLHDHFRWNDARWTLVNDWLAEGHSPLFLQGGYEVNAWLNYDAYTSGERPPASAGPCCYCYQPSWFCRDDTFWVGMAPPPGREYQKVKSILPGYWLAQGRSVSLYRRP
jgi:hypothetical protein